MSSDSPVGRFRTWRFSHILYTSLLPEAASGLGPRCPSINPWDIIKRQFDKLFKTHKRPECVVYIDLRVSRSAFDNCVSCGRAGAPLPDLPFGGYIQAGTTVGLSILQKWLDAKWTPLGCKLCSSKQYREEFIAPDDSTAAAFVYFLVHGNAALETGGRPSKGKRPPRRPPAVTFLRHVRPVLMS